MVGKQSATDNLQGQVLRRSEDKKFYCLNTQTGDAVWEYAIEGRIDVTAAVANDRVYFRSYDNKV